MYSERSFDVFIMEIKTRLKELRKDKRMSYRALADKTGIHWTTLSYIEKNERKPNVEHVLTLSNFFRVSVDYFLCRVEGEMLYKNFETKIVEKIIYNPKFKSEIQKMIYNLSELLYDADLKVVYDVVVSLCTKNGIDVSSVLKREVIYSNN
jgi:transcriptional regulator with XRE-family HTH domain